MKYRVKTFLLVWPWLLLLACCVPAAAQSAAPTVAAPAWHGLQYPADVLIDDSGTQTLANVQDRFARGDFSTVSGSAVQPLGGAKTAWLRIRLPAVTSPTPAVLTVVHPGMDSVVLYHPVPGGSWQAQYAGDSLPVARWSIPYLHPAFALDVSPEDARPVYMAVRHSSPVGVYWQLWDKAGFEQQGTMLHMVLGGYLGFIVLVVILSCVNALNWRDPIHLVYAIYVVILGLGQLSLTGLAGEYFWPDNPWWNDIAAVALPMWSAGWAALLVHRLVIERGDRVAGALLVSVMVISQAFAIGFLLLGRDKLFHASNLAYFYFLAVLLGCLVRFAFRGPRVGLWALAGFGCLFVGSMFPIFRNLNLTPINFYTQFGAQIGAALEIPLVLVALYVRSRERRDKQVRLNALTRVDLLTGVASHRLLMERLEHLLQRHQRDPNIGAVLRVRLVNGSQIRAAHGQQMVHAALVRAGVCVAMPALESDTVGRLADGDFVLLLEGQANNSRVNDVGQRIIAEGLKLNRTLPPDVALQLHVACATSPLPKEDGENLLQHLGRLLDEIATHPPKALRFLRHRNNSQSITGALITSV
jgi:GGDEF domain-containing protein